jgi:hypothetical protein
MNRQQQTELHQRQKKQHRKEIAFISADQAKFKEVAQGASMGVSPHIVLPNTLPKISPFIV